MLSCISFANFKCFADPTRIPFSSVNLLTGSNGRGKSTTLQGLLLMRQSIEYSRTTERLLLNGSCVDLGRFDDIKNVDSPRSTPIKLGFEFTGETGELDLEYELNENVADDMVLEISRLRSRFASAEGTQRSTVNPKQTRNGLRYKNTRYTISWRDLVFTSPEAAEVGFPNQLLSMANYRKVHYVSADRIGPREYYLKKSFTDFPDVGRRGEYTASVLFRKRDDYVDKRLRLGVSNTPKILDQLEAWVSLIFDGGSVRIHPTEANIVIVSINSESSDKTQRTYKPANVGFGFSYALPIIVAGLIAKPNEILIVENPEAHLHPYAQSKLIHFLAKVSSVGVQVFIESHSDHVLNALRIAALDGIVSPTDLNVLYFHRGNEIFTTIPVNSDGSIEVWPEGFFDQTSVDFERLFSI
jgi:predicted ATPase